ncbi:MAG: hypothetical protein IPN03_05245 [Holophagales bacterium]|jgi:hypothetical protein|nr:hypothetical protein [Holophagales bacterium]
MPQNHFGIVVPAVQPPTGVLDLHDADWENLRSIVREHLDGRIEITTHTGLRVLLFGSVVEIPVYLVRVWSEHPIEDIATVVQPELVRIANTHTENV